MTLPPVRPGLPRVRNVLLRRDGKPFVTTHDLGLGTVVTVLSDWMADGKLAR